VADAHSVGVLHRDLKPANIVVAPVPDAGWSTAVVDFGSAALLEPERLAALSITNAGLAEPEPGAGDSRTTALYLAPEQHGGAAATVASDIFALGVMLYQLATGDLSRPLAAGWERDIADPLLREDIAAAAAGDPQHRMASAADLAQRLRSLEVRRLARAEAETGAERRAALEAAVAQARARRPWIALAGVALALGAGASSALFVQARHERDEARRQTQIAEQINGFLARDLLARSSPFKSGKPDESLVAAVKQAAPQIDVRFNNEPRVGAQLHQTIARALDKRSDWQTARLEYARAAALWRAAEGAGSVDAHVVRLQLAMMEARSYEAGSLERARTLVAAETQALAGLRRPPAELTVWLASARGMTALIGNDAKGAAEQFALAVRGADAHPGLFDAGSRLTFQQRLAFANIRLGEGAKAAALFQRLAKEYSALEGPASADVLMVRMNLAQALMIQGRHAEAVDVADAVYPTMLEVLGPEHEMTLQLLSTRAQSEGALERWNAAIADTDRVHAAAVRKQGESSFFSLASLTDGATAKCRSGRPAEALVELARAQAHAHEAFPASGLEGAVRYAWAACLLAQGRVDDAERRLAGIRRAAVAQLAGDPDWGANLDLAQAQIAYARHDLPAARAALAAAAPAFAKPTAEPYQVRAFRKLAAELAS
jgi:tetratricopeptide (TPR) repeat protein